MRSRPSGLRFVLCSSALVCTVACAIAASAAAQPAEPESEDEARDLGDAEARDEASVVREPPRYVALASAGMPLRLTVEKDFGQDRLGAAFVDLLAGYILPGGSYRHGFGVGVSWNLTHDGGYVAPIYSADQIAIMPAYLGYLTLSPDFVLLGHVGVPIVVRGGVGPGLELGAGMLFHLLAGVGIFAELDLAGFAAGDASLSVLTSLEAGIMLNYEVLP